MPIFEYYCSFCAATFEKLQRRPEEKSACPQCGNSAKRSVSLVARTTETAGGACAGPAGSGFG